MFVGVEAFRFDSLVWAKTISAAYIMVNLCVVMVQIHLVYRAARFYFKRLYPKTKKDYIWYSFNEIITMFLVTSAGQVVFFIQFLWFAN